MNNWLYHVHIKYENKEVSLSVETGKIDTAKRYAKLLDWLGAKYSTKDLVLCNLTPLHQVADKIE